MSSIPPQQALEIARSEIPAMRRVYGTELFSVVYIHPVTRAELETPHASRLTTRRLRQELILEHAAELCGGWDELARGRLKWMTSLELYHFECVRSRQLRAARKLAKSKAAYLQTWDEARLASRAEKWRSNRAANVERQRIDAAWPCPPDAARAIETARRRIAARRPDLAPAVVDSIARWLAGAL